MTPDCLRCGACCAYSETWPVFSEEDNDDALAMIPEEMVDYEHGRMKCVNDQCVALQGKFGVNVSCAIYASRPKVCRDFQPGSPGCLSVRGWFCLGPDD